LFDWDSTKYPRKWSEMSFEFKGMFVYHISMMAMMMAERTVSATGKMSIAAAIMVGVGSLSARRRRALGWHWRRPGADRIASGAVGVVAVGLFLGSATPMFSPFNPTILAWYLAGLGIGLFGLLQSLRVVYFAEEDFLADCKDPALDHPTSARPKDARWKRTIRAIYGIASLLIWLNLVGSFYVFGTSFRNGSSVATASASAPIQDHGRIVYVSEDRKQLIDLMQRGMMIGIPLILATGFALHFLIGVRLFPNTPTRDDILARRRS
jgi:hypothetical protein